MREVILTVCTRAAGKSTFCENVVAIDPSIAYISRDQILIELFGSTNLSPYGGGHMYAIEKMWEAVQEKICSTEKIILDTWNGNHGERQAIIRKLRQYGADRVVSWYFVTPLKFVEEWFWQKPGIAKLSEMRDRQGQGLVFYSEDAPRHDYNLFHKWASDIDLDGFDQVIRINPVAMRPEDVL